MSLFEQIKKLSASDLALITKRMLKKIVNDDGCRIIPRRISYNRKEYNSFKFIWIQEKCQDLPNNFVLTFSCQKEGCLDHYDFGMKYGIDKISVMERLKSQATSSGECNVIQGTYLTPSGYGITSIANKTYSLHRVLYWIKNEETVHLHDMDPKKMVRHKCPNLTCINLDHYDIGTAKDNAQDRIEMKTQKRGEQHPSSKLTLNQAQTIADSWRPRKHPEFLSQSKRAEAFDISESTVAGIDARTTWIDVIHPNEKKFSPYIQSQCVKRECDIDWKLVKTYLQQHSKVASSDNVFCHSPCHDWTGSVVNNSLPRQVSIQGRKKAAHIWATELQLGHFMPFDRPIARHMCNNSICVNPAHMKAGTHQQNMNDKRIHGTSGKKLTMAIAREIRCSLLTNKELAKTHNISSSYIASIKNGRRWFELEDEEILV